MYVYAIVPLVIKDYVVYVYMYLCEPKKHIPSRGSELYA